MKMKKRYLVGLEKLASAASQVGGTWEQERVYSSCMHARAMEEFGDRRSVKERTSGRCWFIQSFPSLHLPQPLTTYLTLTLPLHCPTHFVGC